MYHKRPVEFVSNLWITLCTETGIELFASDGQLSSLFHEINLDFAFALFRGLVLNQISSIFLVDNFGNEIYFVDDGLAVSSLLIHNHFSFLFRQGIEDFLLLLVHDLLLRIKNI